MSPNRMETWLNKALEMEARGCEMYERAAAASQDAALRDFFTFLADQESVHHRIIRDLYSQQSFEAAYEETELPESQPIVPSLKPIFSALGKSRPLADGELIAAVNQAMAFEHETAAFYKDAQSQAGGATEKEFLRTLYGEENDHHQALADLKLFYTNPEAWAEKMAAISLDGV